MKKLFDRFIANEAGATAIEYGLISALVVIALIAGFTAFADESVNMYNRIETAIVGATST